VIVSDAGRRQISLSVMSVQRTAIVTIVTYWSDDIALDNRMMVRAKTSTD